MIWKIKKVENKESHPYSKARVNVWFVSFHSFSLTSLIPPILVNCSLHVRPLVGIRHLTLTDLGGWRQTRTPTAPSQCGLLKEGCLKLLGGGGVGIGLRFERRAGAEEDIGKMEQCKQGCKRAGPCGLDTGRARLRKAFRLYFMKLFRFCSVVFIMLLRDVLLYWTIPPCWPLRMPAAYLSYRSYFSEPHVHLFGSA